VIPIGLALTLYLCGAWLAQYAPQTGTNGAQLLIWGFFVSTTVLFHGTATINSFGHIYGTRRYNTPDTSRNNLLLAFVTLGEGWHNNHHHYAVSARQGFFWWEIDITYYFLVILSWMGIIWDLQPIPEHIKPNRKYIGGIG
jgi:stearoyl-CoA desaturase (delta-9 desaturase)